MCSIPTDEDLIATFEEHADVALAIAATATHARACVWPDCLTLEQQLQLADEIGCELIGETPSDPDLTDWPAVHGCVDTGEDCLDPFRSCGEND